MARLKDRWRELRPELVSGLLYRIVATIGHTLRVETSGFDVEPTRTLYGGWHGRSFAFATHFRHRGWWVIVSLSRDGDMQNAIFGRLGYRILRGSTGRGGERAAVGAIRALKNGGVLAMTPDGPRGPAGVVQSGIMLIAQRSGARLVPVGVAASPSWIVSRSWDRYVVPKPFARVRIIAGEPITVPIGASPEEVEAIRIRFQEAIARLQCEAERRLREDMAEPLSAADPKRRPGNG